MKRKIKISFCISAALLAAFALWTALTVFVDVGCIGPRASSVGFSSLNGFVREAVGVRMHLYTLTDWLGLVPVFVAFYFALLGLIEFIRRGSDFKVDPSLLALGGFYIVLFAAYLLFEAFPVNYRPVLIDGFLEASYPSSTTLLVMGVMPTADIALSRRVRSKQLRICLKFVIYPFVIFMVIARLLSGVHWLTDIIGGILLSSALVLMYYSVTILINEKSF